MESVFLYVMMFALLALMWNNGRKRKKAAAELAASLAPGSEVMLTSGIYCVIVNIDADKATVRSGDSTLVVAKGAIARVINAAPAVEPKTDKPAAKKPAAKKPAATTTKK